MTPELTGTAGVSDPGGPHTVPPVSNPRTRLPEIPTSPMSTPRPSPQHTGRDPNIPLRKPAVSVKERAVSSWQRRSAAKERPESNTCMGVATPEVTATEQVQRRPNTESLKSPRGARAWDDLRKILGAPLWRKSRTCSPGTYLEASRGVPA